MSYPTWDDATSYPINSIVWFNNLLYQATFYHDPANTDKPNVEMGLHPYDPAFYGSQRGWVIYGVLPPGYSPSPIVLSAFRLIKKIDPYDDYTIGSVDTGPYGEGISEQHFSGSINNPTIPCPANQCGPVLEHLSGSIYGASFGFMYELVNPVLAPSGDYYINGPLNEPGEPNTLYVWWSVRSPSLFRRSVKLFAELGTDEFGHLIIGEQTFTPTDDTYNVGASTPIQWYAPGNQSVTFTSIPAPTEEIAPILLSAYEIDGNN